MALYRTGGSEKELPIVANTLYGQYSGTTVVDLGKSRHIVKAIIGGYNLKNYDYNYMYYSNDGETWSGWIVRCIGGGTSDNTLWRVDKKDSTNVTCRYLRLTHGSGGNLFYGIEFDDE